MKRLIAILFLGILLLTGGCKKKSTEDVLMEAQSKIERGDLIGARIDLKEIIRKRPHDPLINDARFLLAQCYFFENDFRQSRSFAQVIIDQFGAENPRSKTAFELILNSYNMEKRFAEGIQESEKFIKKLPDDDNFKFKIQCMIADLLVSDEKTTEAAARLNQLIDSGKDHEQRTAALERLVALYAFRENYSQAVESYERYAQTYPDYEDYYDLITGKAYFYEQMGENEKSAQMFDKALKGYGEMADKTLDRARKAQLIYRQGKTFELQKRFEEARKKYDVILSEYGDTPIFQHSVFSKGDAYIMENDLEEALAFYQEQLKTQKEDSPALRGIRNRIAGIMREQARLAAESDETAKTKEQAPPTPR